MLGEVELTECTSAGGEIRKRSGQLARVCQCAVKGMSILAGAKPAR
jgi:hypothetical protein